MQIRNYRPEDFPRLHQIDRICFPPDIAYTRLELLSYVRHPGSITIVAEWGETVIGFVVGRIDTDGLGHVLTMDVIPEARRKRVGSALMETLHREFEKRGVRESRLEVDVSNHGAVQFYEGLHYARVGILKGYYKGRSDAYRMVRAVKPEEKL